MKHPNHSTSWQTFLKPLKLSLLALNAVCFRTCLVLINIGIGTTLILSRIRVDLLRSGFDRSHCRPTPKLTATSSNGLAGMNLFPILTALLVAFLAPSAIGSPDWYYQDGPLRGSLKSDKPLPLYHPDPDHIWNCLFTLFYTRPSELPSRPDYPSDPILLNDCELKYRRGELPPGPVVKRLEGGDSMSFLAWPKTRYFSELVVCERANQLLDLFIQNHSENLITNPLKRAFFQRDLWAVFDHLVGQNIDRFGDSELAKKRFPVPEYEISQDELEHPDAGAMQRREILCRKLAIVIKRLALPRSTIESLPDTYAEAVRSDYFTAQQDFTSKANYLPPGLLTDPGEWVEIDTSPESLHTDKREGQIDYVAWNIRGRSYYRIFWRFPAGRKAVEEYLRYLRENGVDWPRTAQRGGIALKPDVRQIPIGMEAATVQFMIVLDDQLNLVPTRVAESVRVTVYKNVDGSPDPLTNTGRGMIGREYIARRYLLFDNLKQGGLVRNPDDAPTYRVLLNGIQDWGITARQHSAAQSCLACHMYDKDRVGVFSLNTIFCFAPNRGMPGIVIAMGSGPTPAKSRAERIVRWKTGREDYLRLFEYARNDVASRAP